MQKYAFESHFNHGHKLDKTLFVWIQRWRIHYEKYDTHTIINHYLTHDLHDDLGSCSAYKIHNAHHYSNIKID